MRVLIAEDDAALASGLQYLLEKNNLTVDIAYDGAEALDYFHTYTYNSIILDIMMPKKNGLEVLREIRREKSSVPVMMLSAKAEIEDRVEGLEAGADDYLPKPFATKEFVARVKALLRRKGTDYLDNTLEYGSVIFDRNCYELRCNGEAERLNNKEFQLMELFIQNPKIVFSTERLMESVWGLDSEAGIDVVWTYIGFLRKKLKALDADIEIRTVRGAGYSLEMK